jgi:hypothetical protein
MKTRPRIIDRQKKEGNNCNPILVASKHHIQGNNVQGPERNLKNGPDWDLLVLDVGTRVWCDDYPKLQTSPSTTDSMPWAGNGAPQAPVILGGRWHFTFRRCMWRLELSLLSSGTDCRRMHTLRQMPNGEAIVMSSTGNSSLKFVDVQSRYRYQRWGRNRERHELEGSSEGVKEVSGRSINSLVPIGYNEIG